MQLIASFELLSGIYFYKKSETKKVRLLLLTLYE